MTEKLREQLERAKSELYPKRLHEAYHVFRRYFDRIPFGVDKEHAEYVGIFARILLELGKDRELAFYTKALEQSIDGQPNGAIAYALGICYFYSTPPQPERSKKMFEIILRDPEAREWHYRTKLLLARLYLNFYDDIDSAKVIIRSMSKPEDSDLVIYWKIWHAILLRYEKRFDEAQAIYDQLLAQLDPERDWIHYCEVKISQAWLETMRGDTEKAAQLVGHLKKFVEGPRKFRSLVVPICELEQYLKEKSDGETLLVKANGNSLNVTFKDASQSLRMSTAVARLIWFFAERQLITKENLIQMLYGRSYAGDDDDKLVYYHIHALRTRLKSLGVPRDYILLQDGTYSLAKPVRVESTDTEHVESTSKVQSVCVE